AERKQVLVDVMVPGREIDVVAHHLRFAHFGQPDAPLAQVGRRNVARRLHRLRRNVIAVTSRATPSVDGLRKIVRAHFDPTFAGDMRLSTSQNLSASSSWFFSVTATSSR